MISSLQKNCVGAHIFVLCMDDYTERLIRGLNLSYVTCIALSDIESAELLSVKVLRSIAEYCWTLSASLMSFILKNNAHVDQLTYLDADMMFYSSVEPLFEEIGESSIAIIEHRFTPRLKYLSCNGLFCVQWVSFKRDSQGLNCLEIWRNQCIDWCYDRHEDGRMGDQKYLDQWPLLFSSTHVIQHLGAGLAPWNYPNYFIEQLTDGHILVNGQQLIFFHFHQFQLIADGGFDRISSFYTIERDEPDIVYQIYENTIRKLVHEIKFIDPNFNHGFKTKKSIKIRRFANRYLSQPLKEKIKKFFKLITN